MVYQLTLVPELLSAPPGWRTPAICREALVLARAHNPAAIVQGLGVLARLQVLKGSLAEAEATIAQGKRDPRRETWVIFYLPVLFAEVELALRKGQPQKLWLP